MEFKKIQEILDFCKEYNLDTSKISVDESDGQLIYDGNVNLYNREDLVKFPQALKHFKEIKGDLNCYDCKNLKSFDGFQNLQTIEGNLNCYNCPNLESFDGLDNLQLIRGYLSCSYCPNLKDFTGLQNLQTIGECLYCNFCPNLKSFDGLNLFLKIETKVGGFYIHPESRQQEFEKLQKSAQNKMTPPKSLDVMIDDIMKNFDFQRVRDVMVFLRWSWTTTNGIPMIDEIRHFAKEILIKAYNENTCVSSCGFEACYIDGTLGLKFVLSSWRLN